MRRVVLAAALAVAVYTCMVLVSDIGAVRAAASGLSAGDVPVLLALPLVNYAFRFLKWDYLLRRVGVRLRTGRSVQVFLSGFAMAVSPGKFGELLKSCLLRDREGIPVASTSPVIFAERITDLVSMILLAALGLALSGGRAALPAVAAGIVFTVLTIVFLSSERVFGAFTGIVCRIPRFSGRRDDLCRFRRNCAGLLGPACLAVSVPLGMLSWGVEAMVLVAAAGAMGAGLEPGAALLAHSAGTVAGAVSMIPGGLGLTELTVDGLLSPRLGLARATAVTMVMRFATLWFAVALGAAVLVFERRGTSRARRDAETPGCGCGSA